MSATLSLKVGTKHSELEHIVAAVEGMAEREAWPPAMFFRVNLALEEMVINIMDYGYDEGLHEIEITLTSESDTLTIEIVDDGRPFDPLQDAPHPDVDTPVEDRPVGGLGVYLVRTMMDQMHYRRERGKNHLTMITRRGE